MSAEDVKASFHSDDRQYVEVTSLVPAVDNYNGDGTLTATVLFAPPSPREPRVDKREMGIDKDFYGFTPLNKSIEML